MWDAPSLEFLTEIIKGSNLPRPTVEYKLVIQHYRGRNEPLISEWKQARAALNSTWRGSEALCTYVRSDRVMRGPRYDCYGPWPMCPASVADMF